MKRVPDAPRDPDSDGVIETPEGMVVFGRQMNRRDLLRLGGGVAGFAAVQALLAACGGGGGTTPAATTSGAAATSGTSGAAATSATTGAAATSATTGQAATPSGAASPAAGAPQKAAAKLVNPGTPASGGQLKVAIQFDPTSLDPIDTYTLNNGRWETNVYSPLVWRDTNLVLFDGQNGNPPPSQGFGLAESWQYLDDKTLQMKLRSGVTFHNGEPFDANAVKSTFTRMLDPTNKSPQAFNYTSIDTVEVVDAQTIKIHFKEVDPVMITKLAGYGGFITPPKATQDHTTFQTKPAGNGPYKVTEYVKDDHLTLAAWDGYWGPKKPSISTITYRIIPDDNTRLSEFMAGNVDVLTLNVSQAGAAQGNPNVKVVTIGVPTVSGLRLDTSKAPTDKKEVRQAIAHAIDLKTIIATIFAGDATAVGIWQSPFSFGFQDMPPYSYDPNMATQILKQANIQTPINVSYDVIGTDTQGKEMASAVKDMLSKVGINASINLRDQATFYNDYAAGKLGNIVPFGWGGWTLDYDNTYYSMYYTKQSYNPSYSNPQVDKLLDQERNTLDQNQRLQIGQQLNQLIYNDYPDVALYQNTYLWGVSNRVVNFSIPPDERLWWLDVGVKG